MSGIQNDIIDKIKIMGLKNICEKERASRTKKYAQLHKEGVYMAVVGVHLGHKADNDVFVCGNGRIRQAPKNGRRDPDDPDYYKYHPLTVKDRPNSAPRELEVTLELYINDNRTYYATLQEGQSGVAPDPFVDFSEFKQERAEGYLKLQVPVKLSHSAAIDEDQNFHEYKPSPGAISNWLASGLVNMNRYILQFQMLPEHRSVTGLYCATFTGYPSDQLAVLVGGNETKNATHLIPLNHNRLFVQHKFDPSEWNEKKIIYMALQSVLEKAGLVWNFLCRHLLQEGGSGTDSSTGEVFVYAQRDKAIDTLCQDVLDHITDDYIACVSEKIKLLRPRPYTRIRNAEIRAVCEYAFIQKYQYLCTQHWTFSADGITFGDANFEAYAPSESPTGGVGVRAIMYKVVSSCIEPAADSGSPDASEAGMQKVNAFSAHEVFQAYADHFCDKPTPPAIQRAIDDAKQLVVNMKCLKTSSNFALQCLRESCKLAAGHDANFEFIGSHMLLVSRNLISMLLQREPSTSHDKYTMHVLTVASNLRKVDTEGTLGPLPTNDWDITKFRYEDRPQSHDGALQLNDFQCRILGTHLNILARLREASFHDEPVVSDFANKNYIAL